MSGGVAGGYCHRNERNVAINKHHLEKCERHIQLPKCPIEISSSSAWEGAVDLQPYSSDGFRLI